MIRSLEERDWPVVKGDLRRGDRHRHGHVEREAPSWEEWDGAHLPLRHVAEALMERLVADSEGAGYASGRRSVKGRTRVSGFQKEGREL